MTTIPTTHAFNFDFFALFCLCFVFFFNYFSFIIQTGAVINCYRQVQTKKLNKIYSEKWILISWRQTLNCVVDFKSVFGLSHRPTDLVVYIVRVESYLYRFFITYCRFNLNQTALNSINIQFELLLACTHVALFNVCTISRRSLIIHITSKIT